MVNIIEVKDPIKDAIDCYPKMDDKFQYMLMTLNTIKGKLGDPLWSGTAHDKCLQIHEAIKMYMNNIRPICDRMYGRMKDLKTAAERFCDDSENISIIKPI